MEVRPFSFTIRSERFAPLGGQEIAYADLDGSGSFDPQRDTSVFWQNEKGGGLAQYAEIRQALTELGGHASGQQLAQHTGRADTRLEPAQVEQPVVNGRFTLEADGIRADFEQLGSLPVIAPKDGNVATLDVNRDGESEPLHDSLLMLKAYDGRNTYSSMMSVDDLQAAVKAAGGTLRETELGTLAQIPGVQRTWVEESPAQFDTMSAHRAFRVDNGGQLWLDYQT